MTILDGLPVAYLVDGIDVIPLMFEWHPDTDTRYIIYKDKFLSSDINDQQPKTRKIKSHQWSIERWGNHPNRFDVSVYRYITEVPNDNA